PADPTATLAAKWLEAKLNHTIAEVDRMIGEYRLSEALTTLYKFIWGDFCSWYLEAIKTTDATISRDIYETTISAFERMMTLLHPFLPFVTEEVWHELRDREAGEDCIVSTWPTAATYDAAIIKDFSLLQDTISSIRDVRNQRGINKREELTLFIERSTESEALLGAYAGAGTFLKKSGVLSTVELTDAELANAVPMLVGNDRAFLVLNEEVDLAAIKTKMSEELQRLEKQVFGFEKKLGNERFVANAPAEVVALEKKKLSDFSAKIESLRKMLG
ncbi:MAG: class I tRNA ligase family protein, partial [Bacteroidota bacterium]